MDSVLENLLLKIEEYVLYKVENVVGLSEGFDTFENYYRQSWKCTPWTNDSKLSDNLIIMSYIRPICNQFDELKRFEDRDYKVCVQLVRSADPEIHLTFEPKQLTLAEKIEGYIAGKYSDAFCGTGKTNNGRVVLASEVTIPGRIIDDHEFIMNGFIDPTIQSIIERLRDVKHLRYLINCTESEDNIFRLEIHQIIS